MRLYTTVCYTSWPRFYTTYYQERTAPYRRCDKARVLRIGSLGLVLVLRWHRRAADVAQADAWALQLRTVTIGGYDEEAELHYDQLHPYQGAPSASGESLFPENWRS